MKLLDMLERSVERVIQAPVDAVFRQEIQPAEIERRLERTMLDNRRRASGADIMPNAYRVGLSPEDFAVIEPYQTSLVRRLESWLGERADEHNGTLLDRIEVEIDQDNNARRRRPNISATITDVRHQPDPAYPRTRPVAGRTEAFPVARPSGTCAIRILTGQQAGATFPVPPGTSTLGRSPDADIHIEANDVSRNHLRIERSGHSVRITDLGSTNGTRVNGMPSGHATLRNGDEILVGTQVLRFVES